MESRKERDGLKLAGLKTCGTCNAAKPIEQFGVRRASPDGRAYRCVECNRAHVAGWRQKNPGAFNAWAGDNQGHLRAYRQKYYAENQPRLSRNYARWAKANPHVVNSLIAKRNAAKLHATPAWADLGAIRAIYAEASRLTRETGIRHEVDHIYPLQSDVVCGLHVAANLQILTKIENIRKKNHMPAEAAA